MGMVRRVVLAMSGGVDSSASAVLAQAAGLRGHRPLHAVRRDGRDRLCHQRQLARLPILASAPGNAAAEGKWRAAGRRHTSRDAAAPSDAADARRVADLLDIPFYALNFKEAFGRIKDYFADEYLAGRTPNPCVMCNNWLKFGKLWEFAQQVEADAIATGHYAQVRPVAGRRPACPRAGGRPVEGPVVRPLRDRAEPARPGHFSRGRIRKAGNPRAGPRGRSARRRQTRQPGDSASSPTTITPPSFAATVKRRRPPASLSTRPGTFWAGTTDITTSRSASGAAWASPSVRLGLSSPFEPDTKRVVIGTQEDLARRDLEADGLNWLVPLVPAQFTCRAKIRYRHAAAAAEVFVDGDQIRVSSLRNPNTASPPARRWSCTTATAFSGGGWIR